MSTLECELRCRKIIFHKCKRQIRYVWCLIYHRVLLLNQYVIFRCFPHIVNLACKAVLAKFTNISYAATNPEEYDPPAPLDDGLSYALQRDPIAIIQSFTTVVRYLNIIMELQSNIYLGSASSLRQGHLDSIQIHLNKTKLQLLRDVDTRWSSTFLMIEQVLQLHKVGTISWYHNYY